MSDIAIKVENVSKEFVIPHEKVSTLRGAFVNLFKKKTYEQFKALDNVSFEVKKGEFFGIIGRNGSGKSALLKVLAGIYAADKGRVTVQGRISPFLELGIGFNPELSGRDNVYLNGTVLGLTEKQIRDKFNDIVAFSELERFIDQKVKNYSSGMQVRLAFSVAIHARRDILLMDEVLAVGDTNFQQKCLTEFDIYRDQKKTVVLVTHDTAIVQQFCDRALLLDGGRISAIGDSVGVVNKYITGNAGDRISVSPSKTTKVKKNKKVEITGVTFHDEGGEQKRVFNEGESVIMRIAYNAHEQLSKPVFGLAIYSQQGAHIAGPNTKTSDFEISEIKGNGNIEFCLKNNRFFSGKYFITVAVYDWECITPYELKERAYSFTVTSRAKNQYGIINLDHSWKM